MIHHVSHNATEQHIKGMISRMSISRWVKCVWFAHSNAKLLASTARENGRLWGQLATAHDELKFTKRELKEMVNYTKLNPVSLAANYKAEVIVGDQSGTTLARDEYQHVLIELVRLRKYVDLNMLRKVEEAPDAVARRMAEDTGAQWVEEIYPKLATALGVPAHKQNAKRLDHNHNRAVMDQRDSMVYGGRF